MTKSIFVVGLNVILWFQSEREEILSALCRVHEIDTENLDLKTVANLTSGFTGADLNAVLMQARLDVIEEALEMHSMVNIMRQVLTNDSTFEDSTQT